MTLTNQHLSHPEKRDRLTAALTSAVRRWGTRAVMTGTTATEAISGIRTGFADLDRVLGVGGIPFHAITHLIGPLTSGKVTVAYKILAQAQQTDSRGCQNSVALIDTGSITDADYLGRCGVQLDRLLLVRPRSGAQAVQVLLDVVRSNQFRAVVIDSLTDVVADPDGARSLDQLLPQIHLALKGARCALLMLEDVAPPWHPWVSAWNRRALGHYAALRLELERDRWLESEGQVAGYRILAQLTKSRGPRTGQTASLEIDFNRTVEHRRTW
jgi:hypothetical protein